jgi:predicted transposase/invertase (TIGR01784 family)
MNMPVGIDPKVDYAFKKVFGSETNKKLLISLLQAVLKQSLTRPIASIELLNPFDDREAVDDKLAILDVRAVDESGRIYNIEMQMQLRPMYSKRALYYWASQYRSQLESGDDYRELRPTFGIHFLNHILYRDDDRFHRKFQLLDPEDPLHRFNDDLEIHMIELPKFSRNVDDLQDKLEEWCYFLRFAEQMSVDDLPGRLQNPEIKQAMEVLRGMTEYQKAFWKYEDRLRAIRDYKTDLAFSREEGIEQGIEQGRRVQLVQQIQFSQRLLGLKETSLDELSARSTEELLQLSEELKQQLLQRIPTPQESPNS